MDSRTRRRRLRAGIRLERAGGRRNRRTAWETGRPSFDGTTGRAPRELEFERLEDAVGVNLAHARVDGREPLIAGGGARATENFDRVSVGPVAHGIGRTEDRDTWLSESRRQVHRSAIHAQNGCRAPGGVD